VTLSYERISAIAISVLVVLVLAYLAVFLSNEQATVALIALASPSAAVALINARERAASAPPDQPQPPEKAT